MAGLGEILELLHDASERARPARVTVVEWRHNARAQAAFQRYMTRHLAGASGVTVPTAGQPLPDESSWTTSLALDGSTRFREESAGVQAGVRYLVRDGPRWVSWDAHWGAATSDTDASAPPSSSYAFVLDPVGILGSFRLEPSGTTDVAGRAALAVRAFVRPEPDVAGAALLRVGAGADVVDLAIDAERGALLRSEASLDGEPFHRLEVTEIAFGPLPESTFEPTLPDGAEAASRWVAPARLPLHELAAAAPFPVLVPARVPDGWRLVESLFTPERKQPQMPSEVYLGFGSPEGGYTVGIVERPATAPRRDWLVWRSDGDLETADAGEHVEPRHHVRIERDGTLVELSGADPSLLRELARALVPAPTEAPRLS